MLSTLTARAFRGSRPWAANLDQPAPLDICSYSLGILLLLPLMQAAEGPSHDCLCPLPSCAEQWQLATPSPCRVPQRQLIITAQLQLCCCCQQMVRPWDFLKGELGFRMRKRSFPCEELETSQYRELGPYLMLLWMAYKWKNNKGLNHLAGTQYWL